MGVLRPPSLRAAASQQTRIPSSTLRALAISHAPARALGLTPAVSHSLIYFRCSHSPQSVGAIDLGRQASRDLTSEAMKPREAA